MRLIKLLSTALMFHLLVTSISFSQERELIWGKFSGTPPGVTEFRIFTFYENDVLVQYSVATDGAGLFKSIDGGVTWVSVGLTGLQLTEMIRVSDGSNLVYLVSAENGVWISTDVGVTWSHAGNGIEGLYCTTFAKDPISAKSYVGTSGGGVYVTYDFGVTYQPFNNGMETETVLDINYPFSGFVATTIGGGFWQYNSVTGIWEQKNQGNNTLFNKAIGSSGDKLFMTTISNIISADLLTLQWEDEYDFPAGVDMESTSDGQVYAGSYGYGVAVKYNFDNLGGWVDFSEGLPVDNAGYIDVFDIDIDPDGHLWAVVIPLDPTVIGGIFRTIDPVTAVEEISLGIPESFNLDQNYPNPFNPSTTISWQAPVSGQQTLRVYDVLGNEVANLVDEYKPAGSYKVKFDAGSLSSGIYFYTLQAGDFMQTNKMILIK